MSADDPHGYVDRNYASIDTATKELGRRGAWSQDEDVSVSDIFHARGDTCTVRPSQIIQIKSPEERRERHEQSQYKALLARQDMVYRM